MGTELRARRTADREDRCEWTTSPATVASRARSPGRAGSERAGVTRRAAREITAPQGHDRPDREVAMRLDQRFVERSPGGDAARFLPEVLPGVARRVRFGLRGPSHQRARGSVRLEFHPRDQAAVVGEGQHVVAVPPPVVGASYALRPIGSGWCELATGGSRLGLRRGRGRLRGRRTAWRRRRRAGPPTSRPAWVRGCGAAGGRGGGHRAPRGRARRAGRRRRARAR